MKKKEILAKDSGKYEERFWIKAINCLSGFKSVNLIGTFSEKSGSNLSIISSLFHLGANPPLMGFVIRPDSLDSPRHTLANIEEGIEFTVNHVNESIYMQAHQTSARYDANVSEFDACNLEQEFKEQFRAPFVKASNIQLAMRMLEVKNIKQNNTRLVIAELEKMYLPENCISSDGFVDLEKAGTLCLAGLDGYYKPNLLNRLSYAKTDKELSVIDINGKSYLKK